MSTLPAHTIRVSILEPLRVMRHSGPPQSNGVEKEPSDLDHPEPLKAITIRGQAWWVFEDDETIGLPVRVWRDHWEKNRIEVERFNRNAWEMTSTWEEIVNAVH